MDDPNQVWRQPSVVEWSQLLLNSYRQWVGRDLLQRAGGPEEEAHALFLAPFVVVSHGMEEDPLLNYGIASRPLPMGDDMGRAAADAVEADGGSRQPRRAGMDARARSHARATWITTEASESRAAGAGF